MIIYCVKGSIEVHLAQVVSMFTPEESSDEMNPLNILMREEDAEGDE